MVTKKRRPPTAVFSFLFHTPQWYIVPSTVIWMKSGSGIGRLFLAPGGWQCALPIGTCSCPPCARKCDLRDLTTGHSHLFCNSPVGHPVRGLRRTAPTATQPCSSLRRTRYLSEVPPRSPRDFGNLVPPADSRRGQVPCFSLL